MQVYTRDINLTDIEFQKYKINMILKDRRFVEVSKNNNGMITRHRFTILSDSMKKFSEAELFDCWQLYFASINSYFKVLDIFEYEDKTQILMLHFKEFDKNINIDNNFIFKFREEFKNNIKKDIKKELTDYKFLIRFSFPIGIDDDGKLFEL